MRTALQRDVQCSRKPRHAGVGSLDGFWCRWLLLFVAGISVGCSSGVSCCRCRSLHKARQPLASDDADRAVGRVAINRRVQVSIKRPVLEHDALADAVHGQPAATRTHTHKHTRAHTGEGQAPHQQPRHQPCHALHGLFITIKVDADNIVRVDLGQGSAGRRNTGSCVQPPVVAPVVHEVVVLVRVGRDRQYDGTEARALAIAAVSHKLHLPEDLAGAEAMTGDAVDVSHAGVLHQLPVLLHCDALRVAALRVPAQVNDTGHAGQSRFLAGNLLPVFLKEGEPLVRVRLQRA